MTEPVKTLIYVGVAAVVGLLAFFSRPKQEEFRPPEMVGQSLFAKFEDPGKAASLEILKVDEDLGTLQRFKVAKRKGSELWAIPSHENYPADAENQVRDAATSFIDLKVLGVASEIPDDHKAYGVVEPSTGTAETEEGVGMMVVIQDARDQDLARLIVGQEVKGREGQRFVRVPGQDVVYVVSLDPSRFSTKFGDWIEKDLLKLNTFDIQNVTLKDYSIIQTLQGAGLNQRLEVALNWDNDDSKWKLDRMLTFPQGKPVPTELLEGEEVNTERLNEMKNALDEVEIVDVRSKPEGLTADLKADKGFLNDREGVESLVKLGFYPTTKEGQPDVLAANGEVVVGMQDGVEYILRFGNIAGSGEGAEEGKLNRYMLVTTRVDHSKFTKPEKETLPEQAPADEAAAEETAEGEPAQQDQPETETQDTEGQPAESQEAAKQEVIEEEATEEKAAEKEEATEEKAAEKEEATEEEASEEEAAEQEKPDEEAAPQEASQTELEAERARIEKEYQRQLDEYNEKVKQAEVKVNELNGRFADWYYVISEDVYQKIHLNRSDIIQESESAKEEGFGIDAFRNLEEEGLKEEEDEGQQP